MFYKMKRRMKRSWNDLSSFLSVIRRMKHKNAPNHLFISNFNPLATIPDQMVRKIGLITFAKKG